ncbi:hypothetical protein F5146DRAFT_310589 [Armillaria mellea]|nr:hypothetical protein F5146DRAFT_310589 [Armillaria mellea]
MILCSNKYVKNLAVEISVWQLRCHRRVSKLHNKGHHIQVEISYVVVKGINAAGTIFVPRGTVLMTRNSYKFRLTRSFPPSFFFFLIKKNAYVREYLSLDVVSETLFFSLVSVGCPDRATQRRRHQRLCHWVEPFELSSPKASGTPDLGIRTRDFLHGGWCPVSSTSKFQDLSNVGSTDVNGIIPSGLPAENYLSSSTTRTHLRLEYHAVSIGSDES